MPANPNQADRVENCSEGIRRAMDRQDRHQRFAAYSALGKSLGRLAESEAGEVLDRLRLDESLDSDQLDEVRRVLDILTAGSVFDLSDIPVSKPRPPHEADGGRVGDRRESGDAASGDDGSMSSAAVDDAQDGIGGGRMTASASDRQRARALARHRALTRDDLNLRNALESHRRAAFDRETVDEMQSAAEAMVETLGFIATDNDFWGKLEEGARVLTADDLSRLSQWDAQILHTVFEAGGYRSPPPPPVEELADDVVYALQAALTGQAGPEARTKNVRAARKRLLLVVMRARRQIRPQDTPEQDGVARLRSVSRQLLVVARGLAATTLGAAAGAVMEGVGPQAGVDAATAIEAGFGAAVGMVTNRALQRFASEGTTMAAAAATRVIDIPLLGAPSAQDESGDDQPPSPEDAIRAHVAKIKLIHESVERDVELETMIAPQDFRLRSAQIRRHTQRLQQLAEDHVSCDDIRYFLSKNAQVYAMYSLELGSLHKHHPSWGALDPIFRQIDEKDLCAHPPFSQPAVSRQPFA